MERLSAGWRGRRVLLVGGENGLCDAMKAMLTEIGARATCVGTDADAQTLCRALGKGRTSAVLLLEEPKKGSLPERMAALLTVMTETREAGVPLFMLLSTSEVRPYRQRHWACREACSAIQSAQSSCAAGRTAGCRMSCMARCCWACGRLKKPS